jgi:thiamine transport system ATP-binding protein
VLEVRDIVYSYKESLFNFWLNVKKGEIVGILGESGSGKSTLLDLIAGFLKPESGEIVFDGKNLTDIFAEKRDITILFQNDNLFEHLTAVKNVSLGIPRERTKDDIYKVLEKVGLKGKEQQIVSTLSGGQQQRVAIARVLLRKKPILLLDEPFSGLDPKTKDSMLNLVKDITKEQNLCTILVTHDRSDCDKIADKVYEVKNGKIS